MAPMTLHSAKLPCLHPSHLPWDGSLVASDKEQNPRGFSPGNVVMEAAPQERQLLSLNILAWHHQRKLGSLREAPDRSGLRPLQEPMKTSTTLGERAGKRLSILCAPITTLEVMDPVQLIHTLIPARPGQPLLPHQVPPTHKDRASSSPCPDHISAHPRSVLAVPSSELVKPKKHQQSFSASDGTTQEDGVCHRLGNPLVPHPWSALPMVLPLPQLCSISWPLTQSSGAPGPLCYRRMAQDGPGVGPGVEEKMLHLHHSSSPSC